MKSYTMEEIEKAALIARKRTHGSNQWIKNRMPTEAEKEEAFGTGFILCISGKRGAITYNHAVIMDPEAEVIDGKWHINGLQARGITVHGWTLPPSWEE